MAITKTYFATSSAASSVADSDYIVVQQGSGTTGALNEMKKATVAQVRKPLKDVIDAASLAQVGGTGKYVSQISQSSGAVYASEVSFVTGIGKLTGASPSVPPTAKAVVEFVNSEAETGGVIYDTAKSVVNAINANTQGGAGSYIRTISQSSGVITAVPQAFDDSVTENTGNAPTSKAVKTYVENQIAGLNSDVGNSSTLVKSIAERYGKLTGETIALDSSTLASGVPTSQVVKDAINSLNGSVGGTGVLIKSMTESSGVITGTTIEITDTVENNPNKIPNSQAVYNSQQGAIFTALGALELAEVGQDGYYIKKVSQTDGQLVAVKQKFDTYTRGTGITTGAWSSVPSDNNTLTSKAAKDYTDWNVDVINNRINNLDYTSLGSAGSFVQKVSQTDGKIQEVIVAFENNQLVQTQSDGETPLDSSDAYKQSASTAATVTALTNEIKRLDTRIGKTNQGVQGINASDAASAGYYYSSIIQTTGKITNVGKTQFSQTVELGDVNAPSASAVRAAINDLTKGVIGASGSYLKFIQQDTGVIATTAQSFDTSVGPATGTGVATNNNAPTSLAVRTAIDTAKKEVLEQSEAMTYLGAVKSSAAIIAAAQAASRTTLFDKGDVFIANGNFNLGGTSEQQYDVRSGDMLVSKKSSSAYSDTLFDIISGSDNTIMYASEAAAVENNFPVFSHTDGRSVVDSGMNITTLTTMQNNASSSASQAMWWAGKASSSAIFADAEVEPYRQNASSSASQAMWWEDRAKESAASAASAATAAETQRSCSASAATAAETQRSCSASAATAANTQRSCSASAATAAETQRSCSASAASAAETKRACSASAAAAAETQRSCSASSAAAAETQRSCSASAASAAETKRACSASSATAADGSASAADTKRACSASAATAAETQRSCSASAASAAETKRACSASSATAADGFATVADTKRACSASAATVADTKRACSASAADQAIYHEGRAAEADQRIASFANANNMQNILNNCTASASYASSSASYADYIVNDTVKKTSVTGTQRIISQKIEMAPNTTASAAFYVTNTGSVLGYDFNAVSSRKLKENIRPTIISALDIIDKVNVVDFNYISDDEKKPHIGFIAEDTDPLLSTPHMNGMDYTNCIGTLLKAVQEITKGMEKLEKRISKIEK